MVFSRIGSVTLHRLTAESVNRIGFFSLGLANGFNNDASLFFSDGDLLRSMEHPPGHGDASFGDFHLHGLQLRMMSKNVSFECHVGRLGSDQPL